MDLTSNIPSKFVKVMPKLTASPKATAKIEELITKYGIADPKSVHDSIAYSAGSFLDSVYFSFSSWFKETPQHAFLAARFEMQDGTIEEPVLILDVRSKTILADDEASLPEDYPERRVLEETRCEYFPPRP